jgi:hypothetical protein
VKAPVLVLAALSATSALAVLPEAAGAATNTLTATATNTTAPEDVGRRIEVTLTTRVLATGRSRVAKLCRRDRVFIAEWTRLDGATARLQGGPSSKSGRFSGALPLDYGGPDPERPGEPFSGDIPFAGGTFTVTVTAPRTSVLVKTGSAPCKQLTATAQVAIPPAAMDTF